jgi:hypothetical protein
MEDGRGPGNIFYLKIWLDFDWNALLLVKPLHKKWRHNTITEKDDFIQILDKTNQSVKFLKV